MLFLCDVVRYFSSEVLAVSLVHEECEGRLRKDCEREPDLDEKGDWLGGLLIHQLFLDRCAPTSRSLLHCFELIPIILIKVSIFSKRTTASYENKRLRGPET